MSDNRKVTMIKITKIKIGMHKLTIADLIDIKRSKKQSIIVVDVKGDMEQILKGGSIATFQERRSFR